VGRVAELGSFGNEMNLEGSIVEARARIMWGESSSSVHEFLTSNGISAGDADAKIKELLIERNAEIRRLGIRRILIGSVLIGAPGILLYALFAHSNVGIGVGRTCAFLILAALYGLWKLADGIFFLIRPKSEHRSIPDISQ
jgi:hypothetical protein